MLSVTQHHSNGKTLKDCLHVACVSQVRYALCSCAQRLSTQLLMQSIDGIPRGSVLHDHGGLLLDDCCRLANIYVSGEDRTRRGRRTPRTGDAPTPGVQPRPPATTRAPPEVGATSATRRAAEGAVGTTSDRGRAARRRFQGGAFRTNAGPRDGEAAGATGGENRPEADDGNAASGPGNRERQEIGDNQPAEGRVFTAGFRFRNETNYMVVYCLDYRHAADSCATLTLIFDTIYCQT